MSRKLDITGQKFNLLTAISRGEKRPVGGYLWLFLCDCGNTKYIYASVVKSGKTKSCGCASIKKLPPILSTDGRAQQNQNQLVPKEILEPHTYKPYREIARQVGASEHIVKKSLIYHGLFRGKLYHHTCENCQVKFDSYLSEVTFCSNDCKHKRQVIWNRGKTKHDSEILQFFSDRMLNNKLGTLVNHHKTNKQDLFLPRLNKNIKYDKQSLLEKEWLLKADQDLAVLDISTPTFKIPWIDEFKKAHDYYPDFVVEFNSGLRWLVEIKGMCTDDTYLKIEFATKWCRENGYEYRIVTTGMIKKNTWATVYTHMKNVRIPSVDLIMMSHAVAWAQLSPSPRLRVGAVITNVDRTAMLAYGYNGDEKGGSNLEHSIVPGCDGFIHAEENALIKLRDDQPGILYCTDMPCLKCAKHIINAYSIKEVYYLRSYRDYSGISLLTSKGIRTYKFELTNFEGKVFDELTAYRFLTPGGMSDELLNPDRVETT